jgi:hypothetical protein
MNQPEKRNDMRGSMPKTADFVARKRAEWGAGFVNECVRKGVNDREPGYFYAIEAGHVLGTPFPAGEPIAQDQANAIMWGAEFAVFIRTPEGLAGGTH